MSLGLALTLTKLSVVAGETNSFAAPSSPTATQTDSTPGNRSIQFTFSAPDPAPNNYDIQRRVNGSAWTTIAAATTSTTYNDTGLDDGTYQYRVRANYTEGSSSYVTSATLNAFISLYLDFSNRYHAVAGV